LYTRRCNVVGAQNTTYSSKINKVRLGGTFRRKIMGENLGRPSKDKHIGHRTQSLTPPPPQLDNLFPHPGLPCPHYRPLKILLEGRIRLQQPRIHKIDHGPKLAEVILNRRPRQQHALSRRNGRHGLRGFIALCFEPVALVADDEVEA
jgi:hypothetical protein